MKKFVKEVKRFNDVNIVHCDDETGEIIANSNGRIVTVITENALEMTPQEVANMKTAVCKNIDFLKSYRGNGVNMRKYLTNTETATVTYLKDFICYDDCVLRKNGNKLGKPLSVRDLSEILDINYETFRKTMASLKKKQVIGYHTTGENGNEIKWITVNPYIICRGNQVYNWVVQFYSESMWAKLSTENIK